MLSCHASCVGWSKKVMWPRHHRWRWCRPPFVAEGMAAVPLHVIPKVVLFAKELVGHALPVRPLCHLALGY